MVFFVCVRESVSVPVFSNGNIQFLRDVDQCLEETKCDGIMIAGKTLLCTGLYVRDNHIFLRIPDKMSGQINVSLTFVSYRNF